jgi:hypothetical protein
MAVQIQLRRGTAAQWTSANPTLASGEIGIETDTKKEKVGDGTTAWNSLGYFNVNGISFGTTGLTPSTSTSGNVTVAGTLVVANGGTGLTTIPAGNVVIGNGTSALYGIAPGTAGNVLTSIAGAWVSNAAVGGGGSPGGATTQVQYNNAGSFAGDANLTFSGSTLTSANLIVSNLTVSQAVFSSATKQLVSNPITGTGSVVMNASPIITSPSLITPALGSPASGNMAATTNIPVANATGTLAVANGGTGLTSTPANGALDIGNGTNFTRTTLTAGTNVTITNGAGSITIAASGAGASAATPTALGTVYGKQTTSGGTPYLTAYGYNAGTNTTGIYNTAMGVNALATNAGGNTNTAVGYNALTANTSGDDNTAYAYGALATNTTGIRNVAIGHSALTTNSTNSYSTAVGYKALNFSTADNNTALGYQASYTNSTGANNTSVGFQALYSNTTAGNNTAVGYQALTAATTSTFNAAFGYQAGNALTTGGQNTVLGAVAGRIIATGGNNTYIGVNSTASGAAVTNEIVICTDTSTGKGSNTGFITPAPSSPGGMYQGNNSAAWSVASDQRLKKNIVDNNVGLNAINAIQVRNFEYRLPEEVEELSVDCAIDKKGVQLGVIAQELQAVLPDCVKQESTGVLSVDSDNLTWYTINAIKQLSAALDAANARIAALEAK